MAIWLQSYSLSVSLRVSIQLMRAGEKRNIRGEEQEKNCSQRWWWCITLYAHLTFPAAATSAAAAAAVDADAPLTNKGSECASEEEEESNFSSLPVWLIDHQSNVARVLLLLLLLVLPLSLSFSLLLSSSHFQVDNAEWNSFVSPNELLPNTATAFFFPLLLWKAWKWKWREKNKRKGK